MGRSVDLDFTFVEPVSAADLIKAFICRGYDSREGDDFRYILDEDGEFEWKSASAERLDDVLTDADSKADSATFVLTLYFDDIPTGGELIFPSGRRELSFYPTVHQRYLPAGSKFCDTGWYVSRLVPVLEQFGLSAIQVSDYR